MPQLQTFKGTVFYDEQGSGEPLLLLHANPGDPRDYDAVLPALAAKYRVIRLTWPGYGEAPAPLPPSAASAMMFAELLEQFVVKMDLANLRVIGNSVGAYAAARLALSRPERVQALVLVSPAGFTTHNRVTTMFCNFKGSERITRWLNGLMAFLYLRVKTPVVQAMRTRAATEQRSPDAVAVNAALWRSFTHPEHDLRSSARFIQARTMVISGRRDPLIPVAEGRLAAATIPRANFIVLPSGHAPFAEVPEKFLAVVAPFLERCGEDSAPSPALAASG
ncbi:MAG: alpha/beta hydrolase fold protein [Moraxellaceae bacterium]|jgi:pimeloyl-ACP methyl ester carboxylesterase|nr:alpha/beta hydrolase fold protein [Moraxellaceae bacterium]